MNAHSPLHSLLRHVWRHSSFYRELYHAHGLRENRLDEVSLSDLPMIDKKMVLEHFDALVTDPRVRKSEVDAWSESDHDPRQRYLERYLVVHSSGTSGKQASILYDLAAWRKMTAEAAVYLYPQDLPAGGEDKTAYLIGHRDHVASATTALNSSHAASNRLIVSLEDPPDEMLAQLTAFQPQRLTSYASCLGWLAELSLAGQLSIAPRVVVSSSDIMTAAIREKIEQAWCASIFDVYAATEALFLAVQGPGMAEWKTLEAQQEIEVLTLQGRPAQPGEMGRAIVTHWANRLTPLIRYDLCDLVVCGDTRPGRKTLRGFVCRSFEDLPIRLADGSVGAIPGYALAQVQLPGVERLQIVSDSADAFEVQYSGKPDLENVLRGEFGALVEAWGGGRAPVAIRRVERIWNDARNLKVKLVRRPEDQPLLLARPAPAQAGPPDPRAGLHWGEGFEPFAREWLSDSIPTVFERQAAAHRDRIALQERGRSMTYGELDRQANAVARRLRSTTAGARRPVALYFNTSLDFFPAMLGVLKAGLCYLALNPHGQAGANRDIVQAAGSSLLLTDARGLPSARGLGLAEGQILLMEICQAEEDGAPLPDSVPAQAPACLLFTSGSTGTPKPVVLDHRAILHRAMLFTNEYRIGPGDRLALLTSPIFNAALRQIFGALLNGASLQLYSLQEDGAHHLADWLEEFEITALYLAPSAWRAFVPHVAGRSFPHLRFVRLGGEPVLASDVALFQAHFGCGCLLSNGYASSEAGTISQEFFSGSSALPSPQGSVGFVVEDKQVRVVNGQGGDCRPGEQGEIAVRSAFFGPALADAFEQRQSPPGAQREILTGDLGYRLSDGRLVVTGRKDWLIKLRGQWVNLLSVEQALNRLPGVAEAAVICHTDPREGDYLAAFVQPTQPVSAVELRRQMRHSLADLMIPRVIRPVAQLPRTPSGKIDRPALARLASELPAEGLPDEAAPLCPPQSAAEAAIAHIWRDMLGLARIDCCASFFDLGGSSLQAAAMMARLESHFGQKLPPAILFEEDSVRGLAAKISQPASLQAHPFFVPLQSAGSLPPLFMITGIDGELMALRDLTLDLRGRQAIVGLKPLDFGLTGRCLLTIEGAAQMYAQAMRQAYPAGPYVLIGYSFGGHLAIEIGRRLLSEGMEGVQVVLLDTFPAVAPRAPAFRKRVRLHWNGLVESRSPAQVMDFLRVKLGRIYLRFLRNRRTRRAASRLAAPDPTPISAAMMALAAYEPQPYPGNVLLLKALQREDHIDWDPLEPWQTLITGQLVMRPVQCSHTNLVHRPQSQEIAAHINELVARLHPEMQAPGANDRV